MVNRKNKPRVFLSHSKADIEFVRKIREDFRKCQIDPWIDEDDIRHGSPWLDSIFEDGIPTCDSVIVYFTVNSLKSQMVKKEIDASLISKLKDKQASFLPYVESASIRNELRADIQSLHIQEWNQNNYPFMLPKVVAEVWRSFMERSIYIAIQDEQNRSLRLELELQKVRQERSGNIFSTSEETDYKFIWEMLNRDCEIVLEEKRQVKTNNEKITLGFHKFVINIASLVANLITLDQTYNKDSLEYEIIKCCRDMLSIKQESISLHVTTLEDPCIELKTYGLIKGLPEKPSDNIGYDFLIPTDKFPFTEKMFRFRYWLAVNKKLPEKISIIPINNNIVRIGDIE